MRIGVIPHPAVVLAFEDGAGLEQNRSRPPLNRPEGSPPLLPHPHRIPSCVARDESIRPVPRSGLLTQGRDSQPWGLGLFHLFPDKCTAYRRPSSTMASSVTPERF